MSFDFLIWCRDRYAHGLKEEVDEHLFFSEASGTMRSFSGSSMDDSCQLTPLTMSSTTMSHSKQRSNSEIQSDYSTYLRLQSLNDTPKQHKQDHHSYVMGSEMPLKIERDNEPQKTIHRFFDEWPPNNRDSWLNLDDNSSNCSSLSTTQLSISVPATSHVFPIFNSRTHHGKSNFSFIFWSMYICVVLCFNLCHDFSQLFLFFFASVNYDCFADGWIVSSGCFWTMKPKEYFRLGGGFSAFPMP